MRFLWLFLILAGLPLGAYGQEGYRTGRWDMSLNPGWAIPIGTTGSLLGKSLDLQLTVGYQFHQWLTGGVELGYQTSHKVQGVTAGPMAADFGRDGVLDSVPFGSDVTEKYLRFTPFIKVGQWLDVVAYRFRPYLISGLGLYQQWFNSGTVTINGNDSVSGHLVGPIINPVRSAGNAYFGFNAGGGFDIQVDETASVGFDLRYSQVCRPLYNAQFLTPSIRFLYLF